jgi:ribosome-associated protein
MPEKSRTQIKKEMKALQALGEKLVTLSDTQLANPAIPDVLRQAIRDYKTMHGHETLRRQMQYIGRLMRDIDPQPIRELIHHIEEGRRDETVFFKQAESWRDGLIQGDDSLLETILSRFADLHPASLTDLVQTGRKHPLTHAGKRASKQLFRILHDSLVHEIR